MNSTPYANSLFEQPWWLDIVAPGQWREAVVKDEAGTAIARMPYVMDGKAIRMPPLTQTLGIWMAPEIIKSGYGKQKDAINALFAQLPPCRSICQALSPANAYVLPFRWLGCRMEPCFTYRLADLSDCDKLYQGFNKTAKKNIKAARNKTEVFSEPRVETLLELLDKTFEAQKRKNPMSKELVRRIVEECGASGHGKYLEARDPDGNVHSCAYFVYDEQACYYLIGASDSRFRSSGAQSLVLWEGIQFAARHSRAFDFEGSMVEGIENFFRQFGGACTPYYTIRKDSFFGEVLAAAKPRAKRLLGYKI